MSVSPVDILCVGNVVVDAIGFPIDQAPPEGSLMVFDQLEMKIGGCPANTSIDLAKLGLRSGLVAKISDDGLGAFVKTQLAREGVDTRGLLVSKKKGEPTSFSFVMIPRTGNRRIMHAFGCNATFAASEIDTKLFKGPQWVTFEALTLVPKLLGKNLAKLLKAARNAGARTAGDTGMNTQLTNWPDAFKGCWEHFDVFFPSLEEAAMIVGSEDPRVICRYFYERGVSISGVKLGEHGCAVLTKDGYEEIPAYRVKCIDTLGAGDSFMAGLLAGLLKGKHPVEAARLGNAVAAHCVQAVGASSGIPKLAKVEAFMRKTGK